MPDQQVVSRVPPEIWNEVIQQAVAPIPGLMDIGIRDTFDSAASVTPSEGWSRKDVLEAMKFRRSLLLVSKTWRELATPVLYECVVVSPENAQCLDSLLMVLEADEGESGRALSQRTRHLLLVDDDWLYDRLSTPTHEPHMYERRYPVNYRTCNLLLRRIFRYFSRLETLTIACGYIHRQPFRDPILISLYDVADLSSLRKLHIVPGIPAADGRTPRDRDYYKFTIAPLIEKTPRLRTLVYGVDMLPCPGDLPLLPELNFLTVTHHECLCSSMPPYDEIFPSVTTVHFIAQSMWSLQQHFFAFPRPHVTTLILECPPDFMIGHVDHLIRAMHPHIPNITRMHLDLPHWSGLCPLDIPSSVTHLSLKFRKFNLDDVWELVWDIACVTNGTSLEVVRLMCPSISEALRKGIAFGDTTALRDAFYNRMAALPFHLEDWTGRQQMPVWIEEGKVFFS